MKNRGISADYLHKEFPKTRPADDFWGQVCRTVKGVPVGQEHIDMILAAVRNGLNFDPSAVVLDIGCGNGALAAPLFSEFREYFGVDFSEYLIGVAKKNFERPPTHVFLEQEASFYVATEKNPTRFTRGLCYGVFAYFSEANAEAFLKTLRHRFTQIRRVYIGNLPDKERAHLFYPTDSDFEGLLNDVTSPIGVWRTQTEMTELANRTGWNAEFHTMPVGFYSAHYRYDAILTPRPFKDDI